MIIHTDISEDRVFSRSPNLLRILLKDQTSSKDGTDNNIIWATNDYNKLGNGYNFHDQILPHLITGDKNNVIRPRILKEKDNLTSRVRDRAEVFTPAWVCNFQNNLIDNEWFGKKEVFNTEFISHSGSHTWKTNKNKITFPKNKNWLDYIFDKRIEISCGEAPYLVSRYDLASGESIPITERIGLLDRKLRVVSENTSNESEWIQAATTSYKNIYGYEWQGDSLLIARESLLFSFVEYFYDKFKKLPSADSVEKIAHIISWNIWQMDGIKGVIPDSCHETTYKTESLFGDIEEEKIPCEGCKNNNINSHNGIYCYIKDWFPDNIHTQGHEIRVRYIDLLR